MLRQDDHAVLSLEHAEAVGILGQLEGACFAAHDAVAVEIQARRQPGVRRGNEAEGIGIVQVVLDEGAITAGAMVEFVDQNDVRVHGADDSGNVGDLRVVPVP